MQEFRCVLACPPQCPKVITPNNKAISENKWSVCKELNKRGLDITKQSYLTSLILYSCVSFIFTLEYHVISVSCLKKGQKIDIRLYGWRRRILTGNNTNRITSVDKVASIFAEYGDFIRATVRSKVKDNAQAEDIVQNFFISLVSKPIPENVQDIEGFLYVAINHDVIDFYRRARRHSDHQKEYVKSSDCTINICDPDDASIIEDECGRVLVLMSESLPASQAKAIVLRYLEGIEIADIAKQMQVEPRSVSRYICIGLKRLRQMLMPNRDA